MARQRDYKAEYVRRIAHALARGFSRSQGRGHPSTVKRERTVTDIKQEAKQTGVPVDKIPRANLGKRIKGWMTFDVFSNENRDVANEIAKIPPHSRVWVSALMDIDRLYGRTGTEWVTVLKNSSQSVALRNFSGSGHDPGIYAFAVRWKPL